MKIYRLVIALILLTFLHTSTIACDICGCANSGSYFGLMPQSNKSMIGVRYNYLHFNTHPESEILNTRETFQITELYSRFFPINRLQVMAFAPFRFDRQETSAMTKKQSGLGDVTILANYNLFNTFMDGTSSSQITHTLLVGGGIKLPTGRFRYDENDQLQVANANFQPGTGSTDFIVNAFYTANYHQWGLSFNLSRKLNTTNSTGYRFGNQLFGTVDLYRSIEIGKITLTPSLGIYGEYAQYGRQDKVIQDITGGKIVNGSAGVHLFTNRWTGGITGQTPIWQKSASGHVFAKERLLLQVGWLF